MKKFFCLLIATVILSVGWNENLEAATKIIAHKGAQDFAPDDTMAAFQEAKKQGYKYFECDFWYTSSGDLIIMHEYNLKRACGINMNITQLSAKNRKQYPIIGGIQNNTYPTQYAPTVQEAISFAAKSNMKIYLHFKGLNGTLTSAKAVKKLYRIIKKV